jgi:hypothetical protein
MAAVFHPLVAPVAVPAVQVPPPAPQVPADEQDVANAEKYVDDLKASRSPVVDLAAAVTYRHAVVEQHSTLCSSYSEFRTVFLTHPEFV